MSAPSKRTPEEIRASIEAHREELVSAVVDLTEGVQQATNWRLQVARRPVPVAAASAAAGFLLAGGVVALAGIFSR